MTLRVTLEIIPFGDEEKKYTIETFNISNLGLDLFGHHKYVVEHNDYKNYTDDTPRVLHRRHLGAIHLVRKALEKYDGEA